MNEVINPPVSPIKKVRRSKKETEQIAKDNGVPDLVPNVEPESVSKPVRKSRFVKNSPEAKAYMSELRAKRKPKQQKELVQ